VLEARRGLALQGAELSWQLAREDLRERTDLRVIGRSLLHHGGW